MTHIKVQQQLLRLVGSCSQSRTHQLNISLSRDTRNAVCQCFAPLHEREREGGEQETGNITRYQSPPQVDITSCNGVVVERTSSLYLFSTSPNLASLQCSSSSRLWQQRYMDVSQDKRDSSVLMDESLYSRSVSPQQTNNHTKKRETQLMD